MTAESGSGALPALYMLWDASGGLSSAAIPSGYTIDSVRTDEMRSMRAVLELDGSLSDKQWAECVDQLLPDGLFAARTKTGDVIGTVSALHNPRGTRFYFPAGGSIGYLVVDPAHRGHGLGLALVSAAVQRLRSAGYTTIWLGVQDWRTSAIRTYLSAQFVPFLHPPDSGALAERWRRIFDRLGRDANENRWRNASSVL